MTSVTTRAVWTASGFNQERPASAIKAAGSQDNLAIDALADAGWWSMAVADGHGDAAHIRSRFGANAACEASRSAALTLQESVAKGNRAEAQRYIAKLAGRQIVRQWSGKVRENALGRSPNDADLNATGLSAHEWHEQIRNGIDLENGWVERLYGTTLLGCLVGPSFAGAWQIGDGLVAFVDSEGEVEFPLEEENQPLGDSTQSLATKDAQDLFRAEACWENADQLLLIALLTDGIEKAYPRLEDLKADLKAVSLACAEEDPSRARELLNHYTEQLAVRASQTSGDDATIALLLRQLA